MKRRSRSDASSLDLFLDTISNTFGGIIFISILIALLVQLKSEHPEELSSDAIPVTSEEYREITARFDGLSSERNRLQQVVGQLLEMQGNNDDVAVEAKRSVVSELQARLESQLAKERRAAESLAEQKLENSGIEEELATVSSKTTAVEEALAEEKAELESRLDENMEVLQLPKLKRSSKSSVIMILRYGKLYPVYLANSDVLYDEHVKSLRIAGTLFVNPKREVGWDLSSSAGMKSVRAYISSHSNSGNYIAIAVFADSFGDFAELKSLLVEMDFEYLLRPFENDERISISKSGARPKVQ